MDSEIDTAPSVNSPARNNPCCPVVVGAAGRGSCSYAVSQSLRDGWQEANEPPGWSRGSPIGDSRDRSGGFFCVAAAGQ